MLCMWDTYGLDCRFANRIQCLLFNPKNNTYHSAEDTQDSWLAFYLKPLTLKLNPLALFLSFPTLPMLQNVDYSLAVLLMLCYSTTWVHRSIQRTCPLFVYHSNQVWSEVLSSLWLEIYFSLTEVECFWYPGNFYQFNNDRKWNNTCWICSLCWIKRHNKIDYQWKDLNVP